LSLLALGVVYGDIGTSPLYAMREAFHGPHAIALTAPNVLGVLSLVFWSLIIVVTIKYHIVIIRADNNGEGGVLALMALITGARTARRLTPRRTIIVLAIFGAALMYADGALTPAISVLSAVEGLAVATPALGRWVVPVTLGILLGLFLFQRRGTAGVGAVFGPVTLIWFVVLAALGLGSIVRAPAVLGAASPHHAVSFFLEDPGRGFLVLGAVFLVVTGGETLYADLGHFGHRAIQAAWFTVPLPALLLNYFGQGALLLRDPAAAMSPFYHLAPSWALYPLIGLATAATIIASQAVISGSFSLTRQAVQLGYSPRLKIEHTSSHEIGQIYVPIVNWALLLLTTVLVLGFRTSSNIAGAYGVALSTLMVITTVMFYVMSREVWGWGVPRAALVAGLFLAIDLPFLGANALKIPHGGWVPLVIAAAGYAVMVTWKRGRALLAARLPETSVPLTMLLADIVADSPQRVPGTAIFMTGDPVGSPMALVRNLTHNRVMHERVVFLLVNTEEVPHVPERQRLVVTDLGNGFHRIVVRFGFMQDPDVPRAIELAAAHGLAISPEETTYFLGRETILATGRPGMALWRERLFALMSQNARRAVAYFRIPADRVFEVGVDVEL
jgi:KUP system potassium uptake protein